MPPNLFSLHDKLSKSGADIVKIVGLAKTASDTVQMLKLVSNTQFPTIALAMGSIGTPSRLLCLKSVSCYLSYVSLTDQAKTAEGQVSLKDAIRVFKASAIDEDTVPLCLLMPPSRSPKLLMDLNEQLRSQRLNAVCLPLHIGEESLADVLYAYQDLPVQGYSIAPEYQRMAYHVVSEVDQSAQSTGLVDTIARKDGELVGFWLGYSEPRQLAQHQVGLWRSFGLWSIC